MTALDLLAHHTADDLVAFGAAGDKTAGDLLADAGRIAAALPAPTRDSHILLVLDGDRYWMAAALLGTLHRGHAVALPPNARRDSILAVRDRPETIAAIHDSDAGMPFRLADLLVSGRDAQPLTRPITPSQTTFATVFTSGSTGPIQAWPKGHRELVGEAHMLGETFGVGPGDRILGTVAPGHIYGLLFTVLLPLARGAAFCRETPLHAEAVARCAEADRASLLVTVPVGLRSFAALAPQAFPSLRQVFCSTGPLPAEVAADFRTRHGLPVTEILGSTETGGIAARQRRGASHEADEQWTPLEGVRLSVTEESKDARPSAQEADPPAGQRLRVESPFLHPDLSRPFETQDLVQMQPDGRFLHLGRADGIVKVGGRRVSIQEVEESIRQVTGVEDAAVAAIPAEGGRGHQLIAAITPEDCDLAEIRKELRKRFEPSCLPRRMRGFEALPKELNGKVPRARLLRLFGLRADGRPINWSLAWGEPTGPRPATSDAAEEVFEVAVQLPRDYAWFDGHFEAYPVLAGAVQLKELLLPSVRRAFPELGRLERLSRVKFQRPIRPGDSVRVRLQRTPGAARVRFELLDPEDAVFSTGRLVLSAGARPGPGESQ